MNWTDFLYGFLLVPFVAGPTVLSVLLLNIGDRVSPSFFLGFLSFAAVTIIGIIIGVISTVAKPGVSS